MKQYSGFALLFILTMQIIMTGLILLIFKSSLMNRAIVKTQLQQASSTALLKRTLSRFHPNLAAICNQGSRSFNSLANASDSWWQQRCHHKHVAYVIKNLGAHSCVKLRTNHSLSAHIYQITIKYRQLFYQGYYIRPEKIDLPCKSHIQLVEPGWRSLFKL